MIKNQSMQRTFNHVQSILHIRSSNSLLYKVKYIQNVDSSYGTIRPSVFRTFNRSYHTANPLNLPGRKIEAVKSSALIIGCGIAGASAALELASHGIPTIVLTASALPEECNTYYAQGGIIYKGQNDTPDALSEDIMIAGNYVNSIDAVQKLSNEGPECIEHLLLSSEVAVPFEKNENGELKLTMEASHSCPRIVYKGDHTGQVIAKSLLSALRQHPNIQLLSNCTVLELLRNNMMRSRDVSCCGALFYNKENDKIFRCYSNMTLLATGGIGHLYQQTSNPIGANGNGIALAYRLGAKINDMHYVQFHPTTLYTGHHPLGKSQQVASQNDTEINEAKNFLLTEALRGEGGILRNHRGEAFAKYYHPKGELAPRDIVARMILSEMAKEHTSCVYLDITNFSQEYIEKRFPSIYEHCGNLGLDISKEWIPIVPAAHYHCGGIQVNLHGRTNVKNLYAAGEVACTGLHGANRLASTSLLEGLVWGRSVANDFPLHQKEFELKDFLMKKPMDRITESEQALIHTNEVDEENNKAIKDQVNAIWKNLRRCMWEKVGPVRCQSSMQEASFELDAYDLQTALLLSNASSMSMVLYKMLLEVQNAITTSKLIVEHALGAKESIGTHYIIDEPQHNISFQNNEINTENHPKIFA